MSTPDHFEPELRPTPIPPHAVAAIGPVALRHRAEIMERLLPEIRGLLLEYEVIIELCFYDEEAKARIFDRLTETLSEFGRANVAMVRTSFMAGEA